MSITAIEVADYLDTRADFYGGTAADMLQLTPVELWDSPSELMEFWESKDLSHIFPQSTHPELADVWSNIVPEDPGPNRARGAEVMTDGEILTAEIDTQLDADIIDSTYTDDSSEFLSELLEEVLL